jgi:hypothetical protein
LRATVPGRSLIVFFFFKISDSKLTIENDERTVIQDSGRREGENEFEQGYNLEKIS